MSIVCDAPKDVVHKSVGHVHEQKHSTYNGNFQRKNRWNSDCLVPRDKQHKLWHWLDGPREGHVYAYYRLVKIEYHDAYRHTFNITVTHRHSNIWTSILEWGILSSGTYIVCCSKYTTGSTVDDFRLATSQNYYEKSSSGNDGVNAEHIKSAKNTMWHLFFATC